MATIANKEPELRSTWRRVKQISMIFMGPHLMKLYIRLFLYTLFYF